MSIRIILFLFLNFGALALGSYFTGSGVPSEWYGSLNKAPWTPPGWFFGVAWTTIMLCFSVYLAYLWPLYASRKFLIGLFICQWVLNVAWNPIFFYFHFVEGGLFIISALTLLMGYFLYTFWPTLSYKSLLLLPYVVWLVVASSLNGYIWLKN